MKTKIIRNLKPGDKLALSNGDACTVISVEPIPFIQGVNGPCVELVYQTETGEYGSHLGGDEVVKLKQ